jgi:hypothetical protein
LKLLQVISWIFSNGRIPGGVRPRTE